MNNLVLQLRYIGVIPQAGHREYGFHLEDKGKSIRLVVLTIANDIFLRGELMYQEAPDLCYQKVLAELGSETGGDEIPEILNISTSDITHYREVHPYFKGRVRPATRRPA